MKEELWLRQERAESLAIVYLTRRPELSVTRVSGARDAGADLLVRFPNGGVFGVQVKALLSPRQIQSSGAPGEFRLNVKLSTVNQRPSYHLCQFVFVMQTDEGYFRWLTQTTGNGYLSANESETFRKLDNQALSEIMAEAAQLDESKLKIPA